jgi:hypothetical protein
VLERLRPQAVVIVGEGHQAATGVARRRDAERVTQPTARPAVVGD